MDKNKTHRLIKGYGKIFTGMYICSFAAIGALFPLIAQYLSSIGFTGTQIGIVTSSSTAIGILSNSFWGGVYHTKQRNKKLILLLSLFTAILALFLMMVGRFWMFLILYIIVFFFENPIYPLLDATVLEVNYPFGAARKWGAVGFATGIGMAGLVANELGLIFIFPMFSGFFLLMAVLIGLFIKVQRNSSDFESLGAGISTRESNSRRNRGKDSPLDTKQEGGYKELLGNKKYLALLASTFFFNGPSLAHNTYFSFLYIDVGGTIAGMGVVLLLMVISEAPVMAFSERITSILSMEKAMLIAMVISALRFLWYSTSPSPELISATFFLQGIANGIALVQCVKYIAKLVGTPMLSLAIPLFTAISANCGTITCQLVGGIIVEFYGGYGVYFFYGILNVFGILIYVFSGLHSSR